MSLIDFEDGFCRLNDATALPLAAGYLWNRRMMVHATARGFVTAQFMQPEPAKYARGPVMEAKHFMLPEQGTYAHHPGRFLYVKDRDSGDLFSLPHEPVRKKLQRFAFTQGLADLSWFGLHDDLQVSMNLILPIDDACELWSVGVMNMGDRPRRLSLYVYFPLGFMSWMNQSARYDEIIGGIVASSITPYQKIEDYFKNSGLKDKTFLLSSETPMAWETRQAVFEGEGGLMYPSMIREPRLGCGTALYEVPAAILQYDIDLGPKARLGDPFDRAAIEAQQAAIQKQIFSTLLMFGPARDDDEIGHLKGRYLNGHAFRQAFEEAYDYICEGRGVLNIDCPDTHLSEFINSWLPRQVYYHGDTNRLSTDPQTRNFLQDAMGSVYIKPATTRAAILKALSQQNADGSMPDGITQYEGAELKYINQVPHTDHCVWLPICLEAYLDETDDYGLLDEVVDKITVRDRVSAAMDWLSSHVDHRGLNFIDQGDWNDPMNMVGWKGKGVSGWLSLATAHALRLWAGIREADGHDGARFREGAGRFNAAMNTHLWDGDWYGRGITDEDVKFGVSSDGEGRIYLNPQSFAILSGAADDDRRARMMAAVAAQLETPFGVEMIAPAYTRMREDVGRLTQKFPGVAENGSVYNHAAIFYIYSLYQAGETAKAFELLRKMLAGPDESDYAKRGQLPVFVPNYYRGAWRQHPDAAGRSSHLFNTGTASWFYRSVIEGLFGVKGCRDGLRVRPQLPAEWTQARVVRRFRGATFDITIRRGEGYSLSAEGLTVVGDLLSGMRDGATYKVTVTV